jgi:hypothetical protein
LALASPYLFKLRATESFFGNIFAEENIEVVFIDGSPIVIPTPPPHPQAPSTLANLP